MDSFSAPQVDDSRLALYHNECQIIEVYMPKPSSKQLNERAQHLLKTLVEQYIEDGHPVGSKRLVNAAKVDVSPATIRNVMASLEDMGFVESPHTSAGRVPTVQGYRFFVDSLISTQNLDPARIQNFEIQLDEQQDTQSLITGVSEYLSGITSLAGIVTLPRMKQMELRQVEFLPLDDNRILAILVTNQQEVQNRVLQLHRSYSPIELNQIAEFLNTRFSGKDLRQIRKDMLQELKADQQSMNKMMRAAIDMAEELFVDEDESDDYVMAGELKLMEFEELSNINSLRDIFEAFNKKREMIHLLDKCVDAQGVKIFIGEESGYKVLGECSVVTSSYSAEGEPLGVLGVIGPTRIPYKKVIPIVDVTAKLLTAALKSRS